MIMGIALPGFYIWYLRKERRTLWEASVVQKDPFAALYAHVYVVDYTRRQELYEKKTPEQQAGEKENEKFTEREVDGPWWWFVVELVKKLAINLLYLGGQGEADPFRWRFGILTCLFVTGALTELGE